MLDHMEVHQVEPTTQTPSGEHVVEKPVLANNTSKLGIDLSQLPNGRYAVPDLKGKTDYIFLMVTRRRSRIFQNRRFVYGKIITGGEWVEAGTIEVKQWSSDSKELVGMQKPGEFYKGDYEVELSAIMAAPQSGHGCSASTSGAAGICGKTLTDEISRSDGFGPDCIQKLDDSYFTKKIPVKFTLETTPDGRSKVFCLEHKMYECSLKHTFDDEEAALL